MNARSLTVPPSPHCPTAQPAGAAVVIGQRPPLDAPSPRARAALAIVETRAYAAHLRAERYDVAARRLERQAAALEAALAREPIEPADPRCRRLGGGDQ